MQCCHSRTWRVCGPLRGNQGLSCLAVGRTDAGSRITYPREHLLQVLRTRSLRSQDLRALLRSQLYCAGASDETVHQASAHGADKQLNPAGCTYPVLKDVDMVSTRDLAADKVNDPGIVSLSDIFFVVPVRDIARFMLDKRETMCVRMELLLPASHVQNDVWFPCAKRYIAFSAWHRCICRGRVHLEGCRVPWLSLVPINVGQRDRLVRQTPHSIDTA